MMRMFSPRHVYTTTSNRPIAPMPIVTKRCSNGSDSSSVTVMAYGSLKTGIASGMRTPCLRKLTPGLARLIPLEAHSLRVHTDCAYVNPNAAGRCGDMWGDSGDVRFLRPNRVQNSKRLSLF